jgi:hypothetical protein
MIHILAPQHPLIPEIGDFLFATKFIHSYVKTTDPISSSFLLFFSGIDNPFKALKLFNVHATELEKQSKYECPFIQGNHYFGLLPLAINCSNIKTYRINDFASSSFDYLFDTEWQQKFRHPLEIDPIPQSFLGHGYTSGTLPSDGSNSLVNIKVQLSNGDFIIAKTWEWYNK